MLINIRGTSGAGKSTLVRELMKRYRLQPIMAWWRRQPLGYFGYHDTAKTLFIPGHYETDCGGTDTLPSIELTYNLVRKYANQGCNVIWEGLITQSDVIRCIQLHKDKYEVRVIFLNTSLEVCLESVQARRDAKARLRGKEIVPLDPKNTRAKYRQLQPQWKRFSEAGMLIGDADRKSAFDIVTEAFGV